MATRRISIGPGENVEAIVEAVGAATVTKPIEITIDTATTIVNGDSGTRAMRRDEVIAALYRAIDYLIKAPSWPLS